MHRNTVTLVWYLVGIGVIFALLALAITSSDRGYRDVVASQEEDRRSMSRSAALDRGSLVVERTAHVPVEIDPYAAAWNTAPQLDVALQPQKIAMPKLEELSVKEATLQGLTDGRRIAWRVSWMDPTEDANVDVDVHCDAVALQFPLEQRAPFTMGGRGEPVQIFHWKALWQKDIDEHFQDVQDLHPNFWTDLYWFAEGEFPYAIPAAFQDERAQQFFVAREAGNPLAAWDRAQPVEELIAEGFGTLTTHEASMLAGRGSWRGGRWTVVFTRPLETGDPVDRQFFETSRGQVSVAVWEGSAGNVGGLKQWSDWFEYEVLP